MKNATSSSPSLPDTLTASHQTTDKLISCQHLQSNRQISNLALRIIQGRRKVSLCFDFWLFTLLKHLKKLARFLPIKICNIGHVNHLFTYLFLLTVESHINQWRLLMLWAISRPVAESAHRARHTVYNQSSKLSNCEDKIWRRHETSVLESIR